MTAPSPLVARSASPSTLFPASFAQQRLWFLDQMVPGSAAYNVPTALRVRGALDVGALRSALAAVVARQEALRTTFAVVDGDVVQVVAEAGEIALVVRDVTARREDEIATLLRAEAARPFDLQRGPLARALLLRRSDDEHVLAVTLHHVVADGWSIGVLVRELLELYQAQRDGRAADLPELPIQYADYASWQRDWLSGERRRAQLDYWRERLANPPEPLLLPWRRDRPAVQTFRGSFVPVRVDAATSAQVRAVAQQHQATPYMVLLAAFATMLSRYAGQTDLAVGTPIANRTRAELENLIGFFVNTLVLRCDLSGCASFAALLARVRETTLGAYAHQDLPFEYLVEELAPERDTSRNPLFQVMLVFQSAPVGALEVPGLRLETVAVDNGTAKFDLQLFLGERAGRIEGALEYNGDLFARATVEAMVAHFATLLADAVARPSARIGELRMLPAAEERCVLREWNATAVDFGAFVPVHEEIALRAAATPEAIAVEHGSERLTYGDLATRTESLARALRAAGVGPETRVGLYLERSVELVAALVGVLRAGGAYVPLETEWPRERVESVLGDAGIDLVLTEDGLAGALPGAPLRVWRVADVLAAGTSASAAGGRPPGEAHPREELPRVEAESLAYVIFTSGSTGRPKGAGITHGGLRNRLAWMQREYGLEAGEGVLQKTPYGFDVSVWEFLWPLREGARLVVADPGSHRDPYALGEAIRAHGVTTVHFVPAMLGEFVAAGELRRCATLRRVIASGEALSGELVASFDAAGTGAELHNLYGPTEATVDVTAWRCGGEEGAPPIGRAIANVETYVLDATLQPAAVGVEGELYLGGVQLARGYVGRASLTAERFVPHPWSVGGGERLYRTGDVVRWRADGALEYVGRRDLQVKVRGQRIELGEIEAALRAQPGVREAVVVARRGDGADARVVGYLVGDPATSCVDSDEAALLEAEQVGDWRQLYDETYGDDAEDRPAPSSTGSERGASFDVTGWRSSYTGEAIPEARMHEWVASRLAVIGALPDAARVLEIGCGTGLLAARLAPRSAVYFGLDVSPAALERLRVALPAGGSHDVRLACAAAHEPWPEDARDLDLVLLNSVVQYFPSETYLRSVLARAVAALRPGGRVIVGDVRHPGLQEVFETDVELERASGGDRLHEVRRRARFRAARETELLVAPRLFAELARDDGSPVCAVELLHERGSGDDEMSRFRYDVVLHAGDAGPLATVAWRDWDALDEAAMRDLEDELGALSGTDAPAPVLAVAGCGDAPGVAGSRTAHAAIGVRGFPCARLDRAVRAWRATVGGDAAARSVAELRSALAAAPEEPATARAATMLALAESLGLRADLLVSPHVAAGLCDLVLRVAADTSAVLSPALHDAARVAGALTNDPLRAKRERLWIAELRRRLATRLPAYMVPSALVVLDRLPVTGNGKLDARALPAPERSAEALSACGYEAPRDETEHALARIWADVLGLERVGIHDNFFALGGDSILSIQVIGRARRQGLELRPRQLFEHQTIAELVRVAGRARRVAAEQGAVSGPVELAPIQAWLLRRDLPNPSHWNQALLLEVLEELDGAVLRSAVDALVGHHDALRLRFRNDGGVWRQDNVAVEPAAVYAERDLSALPEAERRAAIEAACAQAQRSLSLDDGPIARVLLLRLGEDTPDRLLLVVHHLAVDGVSWRILLEDLEDGYRQAARGRAIELTRKTTSFQAWAERLHRLADDPSTVAEASFWCARPWASLRPLPLDHAAATDREGDVARVTGTLDERATERLLREAPQAYRAQVEDLLLTALARVLVGWTGHEHVLVEVEGHGREELFDDADVSRTVGWFTSQVPLLLGVTGRGPGEDLKRVKEERRAIPRAGIGFGLLRELGGTAEAAELRRLPPAEIAFNYLGQLDAGVSAVSPFAGALEDPGPARDPEAPRPYRIEVNASVVAGRLSVVWRHGPAHAAATVRALARAYDDELRELIEHCTSPGAGGVTPSDFPLAELDTRALERLAAEQGGDLDDVYPMTALQQGLLLQGELAATPGTYVQQVTIELLGPVDEEALEQAWASVLARHPALRTAFWWDAGGRGLQVVRHDVRLPLSRHDWRRLDATERAARRARLLRDDRASGFDPGRAPLMRVALLREEAERRTLVWTHHHALLDGWSVPLVLADVQRAYAALARGDVARRDPGTPYRSFVAWLAARDRDGAEAYFRARLAGAEEEPLAAVVERRGEGGRERLRLSLAATRALEDLARRERVTLGCVLQAAWALLLARCTSRRDVVFGVTVSGRPPDLDGIDDAVGLFVNTLPLRVPVPPSRPLGAWLREVQALGAELREWEHVPLASVLAWWDGGRGARLFDTLVAIENYPVDAALGRGDGALATGDVDYWDRTHYGLTLVASPGRALHLQLGYDGVRYDANGARRMLGELAELLQEMADRPAAPLGTLATGGSAADAASRHAVATRDLAGAEAPVARFVQWAARRPDAIAVECGEQQTTYGELAARSAALAAGLRARGLGAERRVGVYLERSVEMVVAILGVLRAGAAYVPIDPETPAQRVRELLADARVDLVLTDAALAARVSSLDVPLLTTADAAVDERSAAAFEDVPLVPESLAYVIYTSGSTGRPKGTQVEHRQVARLFAACDEHFDFGRDDVWTLFHSAAFDFSVWELWGALAYGGKVVVVPYETSRDPEAFHALVAARGVTVLSQTPSAFAPFAAADERHGGPLALRWVVFGGEALDAGSLRAWVERRGSARPRLANMYGITETTVHVTFAELDADRIAGGGSPIGVGLADLETWILDADLRPLPPGVAGELYVGGAGVCRGYLDRPALTAERFVPHPFAATPGARLYRSGDVVRRRQDGSLEYAGRRDAQVKLRGHRIELGEIEAVLRERAMIREAAVIVREDAPGDRRLVAYVVGSPERAVPGASDGAARDATPSDSASWLGELRVALRERLPGYMVPGAFVVLERLPLTTNGKLDRRALPAPERAAHGEHAEPDGDTERALAEIWRETLGVERVGRDDDFFVLGGHSLLATRVLARVRERLGVELPLRELFAASTLRELACEIERRAEQTGSALDRIAALLDEIDDEQADAG